MRIFLISGDGDGVGKTTFAAKLVGAEHIWSLARPIREELQLAYPGYPWFAKEQSAKATIVRETGKTVRDMLVEWGEGRCAEDPYHYVYRLIEKLKSAQQVVMGTHAIAIDDVRKTLERDTLRAAYPHTVHFHIVDASWEPTKAGEAARLSDTADYLAVRNRNR